MSGLTDQPGQWPPPAGPVPAETLPYVIPDRAGRPTLITAIGVLSIVLACIGGFWGLITTFQALGLYMTSVMASSFAAQAKAAQSAAQTTAMAVAQQGGAEVAAVGPRGMSKQEREAAVASLTRLQPLTPARGRQLDAILASSGHDIAPGEVTDSGRMPQMHSDEQPPNYFVTPRGRLEVFNDRAVFFPVSGATVRASAPPEPPPGSPQPADQPQAGGTATTQVPTGVTAPSTGPAATGPAAFALTPAEVQAVVQQAQSTSGNALSAAQISSLTAVLSAPGQQLATPGAAQGAVISAYTQPDKTIVIVFSTGGSVTLGPQGGVVKVTAVPVFTGLSLNPVALGLMLVTSLLSMALAVYLLVCGILTLRQSPRGRRLHLVYAFVKIPLSVAAGIASAWVARDMVLGMGGAGAGVPTMRLSLFTGVLPIVLGCAYPVGLLIALNVRSVREYYSASIGPSAGS
jgi:hypothetical protein